MLIADLKDWVVDEFAKLRAAAAKDLRNAKLEARADALDEMAAMFLARSKELRAQIEK